MMSRHILAASVLLLLASCSSPSKVGVTSSGGGVVQTSSRSEPIFYNGQHYQVNYTYNEALRLFDMKVRGTSTIMTPKDRNSATAIATSALRYFACPDSQSSRLVGEPQFASATWSLKAKCA